MPYQHLIVDRKGPLARVILNRAENLNTLSIALLQELKDLARGFEADPEIRVIILSGASGVFSAGLDLRDPEVHKMFSGSLDERRARVVLGPEVCLAWEEIKAVTIAAIEGFCIGGGVSLALACDFRILGRSAYLRIPEIELGLNYSWGSVPRLVNLAGPARAKEMIILAEKIPAERCLQWGLAERVVEDGRTIKEAATLAGKIIQKPPIPVTMTKQAVTKTAAVLDQATAYMDADQFLLSTYSRDHQEGLNAFLRKRPPDFKGR